MPSKQPIEQTPEQAFGAQLLALIKDSGLDIAKCARKWEVNQNTLYKWCKGIIPMNPADYAALQAVVEGDNLDLFLPTKRANAPIDYKALYLEAINRIERLEGRVTQLEQKLK